MVGGLSSYLSTHIDDLNITSIATGGSVDNNRQIRQDNLDTWFTHSLTAHENWTGTGIFDGQEPYKDYRLISGVYENHHHFVALESSGIKTLADLEGKKVVMGNTGSGGAVNSENILKAAGLWDKVDAIYMNWDEAGRALMNGQIDCMGASSAPLSAVVTLDAQRDIRLVEPTAEQFKMIFKEFPSYSKSVIPGGTYSTQPEDSPCVAFLVYWAADKDTDPEAVKKMMGVAFDPERKEDLGNIYVHLKSLAPKFDAMEILGIPLHPGAVEFYRGQGMEVPASILPPEMK
jgi:TRAP transporter TAXI family solute receptor